MKLYLSPQRNDGSLKYKFSGTDVEVIYNKELKETFDLLDIYFIDEEGEKHIKQPKKLPFMPILNVEEKNGMLYVTVINFYGFNASDSTLFPDWIEVDFDAVY